VTFSEAMDPASLTSSTMVLSGPAGAVTTTLRYDSRTRTVTLAPVQPLAGQTTYQVSAIGGAGGITDVAGNPLAATDTWSFTTGSDPTAGPGGPVLVVTDGEFGAYLPEILRAEGLNLFTTGSASALTATELAGYAIVVLGAVDVSAAQASALSGWVSAGGNLVALRPDSDVAALAGLTGPTGVLSEGYLKVVTTSGSPGAGITADTMQYHGSADRYSVQPGTSVVATLYSTATTATSNPAVTLRTEGTNGGQVAAFTYNLPQSITLTRQGNPDWVTKTARPAAVRPVRTTCSTAATSPTTSTSTRSPSPRPTSSSGCWPTSSSP
jgi:hypothetical protein